MKQRQTATITAFLCLLALTAVIASASAETAVTNKAGRFTATLDKWGFEAYNTAKIYQFATPFDNATAIFDWTGVTTTNATSIHGYNFYLLTSNEAITGYVAKLAFNQQAGETTADFRNSSLAFALVTDGTETPMTVTYNAHNFKIILNNETDTASFYADGVKVYQQAATGQFARVAWQTIDISTSGNNNEGAYMNGYVSISVTGAGSGLYSSFSTTEVTSLLTEIMPLIMGIVMISVVVGVVAIVPKMIRRIKI